MFIYITTWVFGKDSIKYHCESKKNSTAVGKWKTDIEFEMMANVDMLLTDIATEFHLGWEGNFKKFGKIFKWKIHHFKHTASKKFQFTKCMSVTVIFNKN